MPYIGVGKVDKRLQDLKERQAARRSEVTAANKREDAKLNAFLNKLDTKHDRDMINLNTKLHVTKIDLIREIQKDTSPTLLRHVQKQSKHLGEKSSASFQPKNTKFGTMRIPTRINNQRDVDSGPTPKVYPFHLIKSENNDLSRRLEMKKKKELSAMSPRQFPILAAKHYRESQIRTEKRPRKTYENLEGKKVVQNIISEKRDGTPKSPQSEHSDINTRNSSLPPVSAAYASLSQSFPPPNSPRNRRQKTEFSLRNKATKNDPSNDELRRLRSGQYFLRYSSSIDNANSTTDDRLADFEEGAVHEDDGLSEKATSTHSSQRKSHIDEALSLVEDINKPKQI